ncbi:putative ribonuclease H-like domain-containing protein, partial [Tanacetum coccineum]
MNYELVTAGNQTNKYAGIKDNVDAVPTQQYILLPFFPDNPQSSEDAITNDAGKKTTKEPANEAKLDKLLVQQKEGYANSTNRVSTISLSVSAAGQGFENDLPTDPLMPNLEDTTDFINTSIFSGAYDDEDLGAGADLNNLETTMNVSPIPTTRIHKDRPKEKIIGDPLLALQTRRMTKIEAIRLFLAYASFMGFIMYQMDVKNAFLYATIEEEVYVCQPPGFEDPQFPDKVYKVEKALYGLHQAPRAWYETLSTYLLEIGFRRGTIDKTLFIKKDKCDILLVQVYVDDIIFGSTKKSLCVEFEQMMQKRFQMSSIGELTFFLGLFQVTPKVTHLHAVKRIFRYLNGQPKLGLWYPRDSPFDLEAFSYSDYARASLDRKSTTRGCQFLGKRDSYEKRLIQVIKINTDHNVTDLLTNAFDVSSDEFRVKTGSCKVNAAWQDLVLLGK